MADLLKILLVEDDPDLGRAFMRMLGATPDRTLLAVLASNAEEAIELLDVDKFDLVLGDKLLRESDFLRLREGEYDGEQHEGRRSRGTYVQEREAARPKLSAARQRLEEAFVAHVSGQPVEAGIDDLSAAEHEELTGRAAIRQLDERRRAVREADVKVVETKKRGRSLGEVIEESLKLIPEDEGDLIASLKAAQTSASFAAPEIMQEFWGEAQDALQFGTQEYMKDGPENAPEWVVALVKLWNNG